MIMNVELEKNKIIRISGPASIKVVNGSIRILGATYSEGERVVISKYRSYALKCIGDKAVIEVSLGDGGAVEEPSEGEEVIDVWENTVEKIINECSNNKCKVIVVGPVESGKSSLTALIANVSLEKGLKPIIIDADVGQADIGPPGFISAAIVENKILWLRDLKASYLKIVGSITPAYVMHKIISNIMFLVDRVKNSGDVVVIDTDGWVQGYQAIEYKIDLIRTVNPTHVIVLADKQLANALEKAFQDNADINVVYLPSPKVVRKRDRDDRRYLRSKSYRRYLEDGKVRKIKLREVALIGSALFIGEKADLNTLREILKPLNITPLYASSLHNTLFIVVDKQQVNIRSIVETVSQELGFSEVYVFTKGFEKGLLVGLVGEDSNNEIPGIIVSIDFNKEEISIQTKHEGKIRAIIFSKIKLSDEWEEVGKPSRYMI